METNFWLCLLINNRIWVIFGSTPYRQRWCLQENNTALLRLFHHFFLTSISVRLHTHTFHDMPFVYKNAVNLEIRFPCHCLLVCLGWVISIYKIHMGSQSFHQQLCVTCYGVFSDLAGILRDILLVVCILGIKKIENWLKYFWHSLFFTKWRLIMTL